jgi:hypothetical protein
VIAITQQGWELVVFTEHLLQVNSRYLENIS